VRVWQSPDQSRNRQVGGVLRPCEAPASHTCGGLTACRVHALADESASPFIVSASLPVTSPQARFKCRIIQLAAKCPATQREAFKESWNCFRKALALTLAIGVEIRSRPRRSRPRSNPWTAQSGQPHYAVGPAPGSAGDVSKRQPSDRQAGERHQTEAPPSHTWGGFSRVGDPQPCGGPQPFCRRSRVGGPKALPSVSTRTGGRPRAPGQPGVRAGSPE